MLRQQSLFGPPNAYGDPSPPRAHRADPATSHEAAVKVGRSAKAALHRQIAFAIVKAHPGHTGMELWELATAEQRLELGDHHEIYRKLNDLRHAGLVTQGDARVCTVRKVRMVVWDAKEGLT